MRKWISLLIAASLVTAFLTDVPLHSLAGFVFLLAVFFHVRINLQVYRAYSKNPKFKCRFFVENVLFLVWAISFIAAILTMMGNLNGNAPQIPQSVHSLGAFLGAVLIVVHGIQHRQQVGRYFR